MNTFGAWAKRNKESLNKLGLSSVVDGGVGSKETAISKSNSNSINDSTNYNSNNNNIVKRSFVASNGSKSSH